MAFDFQPAPHTEAAALIRNKPAILRRVFDELLPELRGRAFTIAGLEATNVMQRVKDAIAAIAEGTTWDQAKESIAAELDPFIGGGAERRAELLLRTHGFQSFQSSNWRVAQEDADTTHLQYLTMEDDRVRPAHAALEGIILPKNDPFWLRHFPPWEWGCRCRTRPLNPDLVAEAKAQDQQRAPDDQLVMSGAALKKLREGVIVRQGQTTSVLPPEGERAFQWQPDDLRLPLETIGQRYDPEEFSAFKDWAGRTEIAPGVSVLDWLAGKPIQDDPKAALAFSEVDAAQEWADENMHPDDLKLTPLERESLERYQQSSRRLNQALQAGELAPEQIKQTAAIDRAFKKSSAPEPLIVWHGSHDDSWSALKPGDIVDLRSYLSTTLAEEFDEFKKNAWVRIHVPAGAPAIYMDDLDGDNAHEVELLLSRRGQLKVISVDNSHGFTYVDVELM